MRDPETFMCLRYSARWIAFGIHVPEVRRAQKMFSSQVKMFVGLRCCRSRTKRLKEPRRCSFLFPAKQMSNFSLNAKKKGTDVFFVFHPHRATLHSGLSKNLSSSMELNILLSVYSPQLKLTPDFSTNFFFWKETTDNWWLWLWKKLFQTPSDWI